MIFLFGYLLLAIGYKLDKTFARGGSICYNIPMIETIHSTILGVVQGISEFLPISSSAHLVILPYLFNWRYNGLQFDVALHFGTVIAIVIYFWNDWKKIIRSAFTKEPETEYPSNILWQIIIATIPAGIIGFLIADFVDSTFHSPYLLVINLIIFGLLLWLADKLTRKQLLAKNISYLQSFIVGLAQSIALVPGVSRSGITIIASRSLGLNRESAAKFSFLLGTPAMIGAFTLEARKMTADELGLSFFAGVVASALAGALAIKFLLAYLKKSDFSIFVAYRIILAIIVIIFTIYHR